MEQPKTNTEEIKQKIPESQEVRKEITIEDIDEKLVIEEGILGNLNEFAKDDVFKNVDFKDNIKIRGVGVVDEKFDEVVYGKATVEQKILNFVTFGLAKKNLGLIKSKERGLLNQDIFNKEIEGKEIEVGQNKEERGATEKLIGDFHKELNTEDLGKRQITKKFEFVDGKIIKIVKASRTEQGILDEAGKLLNEKIGKLEKGAGVDLVKEKEGLEKHYSSKEKIAEMTKYLGSEAKEEINKKINQEGIETQERIKEKEDNLKAELDVFRIPFQERLDKTSELVDNFSSMLKDTKEAESKYNSQLKNINLNIQQAQKSGLLEESKKEVVKELESKKMEFEEKAKEFGERKSVIEAKLGQLKINKADLKEVVNRLNDIGKTKKEITEEKTIRESDVQKKEKSISETPNKEEKKETARKSGGTDIAEDFSFMGKNKKEDIEETKGEGGERKEFLKTTEKTFTEKEIENIVTKELKAIGFMNNKKIDQKSKGGLVKHLIGAVENEITKSEKEITEKFIKNEVADWYKRLTKNLKESGK